MPLQTFSFPFPETRFIRAGGLIYKFKIRAGSSYSGVELLEVNLHQELEDIIRAVLGNLDSLQPFSSTHFNVFPYKKQWEGASKVMCKHSESLRAYPFILLLYVERNTQTGKQETLNPNKVLQYCCCVSELQSKRWTGDSPLESAALKDLSEDVEAEHKVSVVRRLNMDSPQPDGDEPQLKSDGSTVTGSGCPGEVHPEGTQEDEGEGQWCEEGENSDTGPGILIQLARQIFPFSWFFKGP